MKLLLDENLSRRILGSLQKIFPGSSHVAELGLEQSNDKSIWEFATAHRYDIVTKDDDFKMLLQQFGHPPRVIKLRMGNCSKDATLEALVGNCENIRSAFQLPHIGMVEIG